MNKKKMKKKERQSKLISRINEAPFVTDEELSEIFKVSIQTIRLDRIELGIPELRERIKKVAKENHAKVTSLGKADIIGELIVLEVNNMAISFLQTDSSMAFKKTNIIKGHYIFSMAESLALAVIDEKAALTGVVNMKYNKPVISGEKLVANAKVSKQRDNKFFVHVKINVEQEQVFRGKFILIPIN